MLRLSPADLLLLLVVLVWGTDFAVLKWALAVMHPHVANALRFLISGRVLGTIAGGTLFGNGMMLVAAMLWGSYTALAKRLVDQASILATTFFGVMSALPVLLAIGGLYEPTVAWNAVGGWAWGSLLFSRGRAVGLMFVLWNQAVQRVGSSHTAAYYYLVPFVALVAGAVLLGEPVTVLQVAGGGLIIGGLVLVRWST